MVRCFDVNWVWAEMPIIYHAVLSIPIILVELAYPKRRFESWVIVRTFWLLVTVLIF
ncbi:MAG: hypothetical protein QXE05_08055 [Nitrososphaeria archaeon]